LTQNQNVKITIASRKLAIGPAATTAARCQTGLAWKAPARSSALMLSMASREGTLAAFSSSMNFT